jgi:hypothetical protein
MSSSFVGSHDPIISVQKKLYSYYRVRTFYQYFMISDRDPTLVTEEHAGLRMMTEQWHDLWCEHITHTSSLHSTSSTEAVKTCVWLHSYIIFAQDIKYWSSQNLCLTTACSKTVTQLLFLNSKIICKFFQQNLDQNYKHCLKQWHKVNTLSDVW